MLWTVIAFALMSHAFAETPMAPNEVNRVAKEAAHVTMKMDMLLTKKYLVFPRSHGHGSVRFSIKENGKNLRGGGIQLNGKETDDWSFIDIADLKGRKVTFEITNYDAQDQGGWEMIYQSDVFEPNPQVKPDPKQPGFQTLYQEPNRPQFHFSAMRGYINDPNGLVFAGGLYHLYFQHLPYQTGKCWGHATSKDLVHWQQQPVAIYATAWSGSAIVDKDNLSGLRDPAAKQDLLLAYFSHIGHGQCLATSNDGGMTMQHAPDAYMFQHLPGHEGRDPKIFWHEPTQSWIIAIYDTDKKSGDGAAIYSSKDCKNWKFESKFIGPYECPDLFELAVDGDKNHKKWIIHGASGYYYIGTFDGHQFTSDYKTGFDFSQTRFLYAAQTWNNVPESDGRRLQIAWARYTPKDAQWNHQMLFPVELSLRTTDDGLRMFANPVREIEGLYKDKVHQWEHVKLEQGRDASFDVNEQFLDMTFVLKMSDDAVVDFNLHGQKLSYGKNATEKPLLSPVNGKIKVRILKDCTTIETYAFDGRVYIPFCATIDPNRRELVFSLKSGTCEIESFQARGLNSAWQKQQPEL